MKNNSLHRKFVSILSMAPLFLIAGFIFIGLAPVSPVYANTLSTPTPRFPKVDEHLNQVLSYQLKREQAWLAIQQNHLDKANQDILTAQNLINQAQAEGKDVADLQAGLTVFKAQIGNAQSDHTTAAGIISTHAGFDSNGVVTDSGAAHQTVIDARQSLDKAHTTIDQAVRDFSWVVKDWKRDHLPTPVPTSTN
jgi:hypothetical protein